MSFWSCTIPDCPKKSLFVDGDCRNCGARLCGVHAARVEFHPCLGLDQDAEIDLICMERDKMYDTIYSKLDLPTMLAQAQTLRPGHTCQVLPEDIDRDNLIAHGTNIHFRLTFDDGKRWLVRLRKIDHGREPHGAMRTTALSEAATFRALREGGVNVPQVWVPDMSEDPHSLLYYFVEQLEGHPQDPFSDTRISVPTDPTVKIIYNVAKWYLDLEKVQFDKVGSLHFDPLEPDKVVIGPVVEFWPQTGEPPFYKGPYKTAMEHYADFFDTAMEQIAAGTRSLPQHDLDDYLIALEAKSLVMGCKELGEGPWYMKHADDSGDHFLVTEDGTVSGVIDWDWSYTSCKADAFVPPLGFNDQAYWCGSNSVRPFEAALMDAYVQLGRGDLAELVRGSKKYRRLNMLMEGGFPTIMEMRWIQHAFSGEPDPDEGALVGTDDDWRLEMKEKYQADAELQVVVARHEAMEKRLRT